MRHGFTLIELLVIVAVIGLLMTIMLPSYMSIQERAHRNGCQNNHHQLILAVAAYAAVNDNHLTFNNWLSLDGIWQGTGWLYDYHNLKYGIQNYVLEDLENNALWSYMHNYSVYRCPAEEKPYDEGPSNHITSYLMNGAATAYGARRDGQVQLFRTIDVINFVGEDAVLLWEAYEWWGSYWNDGSSTPNQDMTHRHGDGATVGLVCGATDWFLHDEYELELYNAPGRLWWNPRSANGDGKGGTLP